MLLKLYRTIVPLKFRLKISGLRTSLHLDETRNLYKNILEYYRSTEFKDEEERAAISHLKDIRHLEQYPYPFINVYSADRIKSFIDGRNGLPYVNHNNQKLYFPRDTDLTQVKRIYNGIMLEQDQSSAHCYFTKEFHPTKGGIFIDIGSAEGLISLNVVAESEHVYIFECEEKWIEPLNATFEPWKDKVTIIRKFVSDKDLSTEICLDTFFKELQKENRTNVMIKIDVEGAEDKVLGGSKKIMERPNTSVALCTYHKEGDDEKFKSYLQGRGFLTEFSKGYMIPFTLFEDNKKPPYLRRGVIRAWR